MDPVRIILAFLLPPLAVYSKVGLDVHFWVNVGLTLCGYAPGVIHALYVIISDNSL